MDGLRLTSIAQPGQPPEIGRQDLQFAARHCYRGSFNRIPNLAGHPDHKGTRSPGCHVLRAEKRVKGLQRPCLIT